MKSTPVRLWPAFFAKLMGSLLYVLSSVAALGLTPGATPALPLIPSARLGGNDRVAMRVAIDSPRASDLVGLIVILLWYAGIRPMLSHGRRCLAGAQGLRFKLDFAIPDLKGVQLPHLFRAALLQGLRGDHQDPRDLILAFANADDFARRLGLFKQVQVDQ